MTSEVTGTTAPGSGRHSAPRRGLAIGCGGTLGFAWTVAALASVRDALDWDPREATAIIGTSAGAEFVTMLGRGVGVDELVALQLGEPAARPALLAHTASAPGRIPPLPSLGIGTPRLLPRRQIPVLNRLSGNAPPGSLGR